MFFLRRGPIPRAITIVCACSLAINGLTYLITGGWSYWESHAWPHSFALLIAAPTIWWYSDLVERRAGLLPESKKVEEIHALRWCAVVVVAIGLYVLMGNKAPGPAQVTAAENAQPQAR